MPDSASAAARTPPSGGGEHLVHAVEAAASRHEPQSAALCDAVETVVDEAKRDGQPPERVLVLVKRLTLPVLDAARLSRQSMEAFVAWIVRCAVKAYYRPD